MAHYQKPATSHELRQRVFTCIDKLSDRSTLSQASGELDYLARTLTIDSLSIFLSCILSIDSSSKSSVRVHCVKLISLLAQTHTSSLSPHVTKIVPSLLRRLRESDSAVRAACVTAAASLSPVNFKSLLEPLFGSILIEQDSNSQIGSCLCLKAAIDAAVLGKVDEDELKGRVLPKLLKLVRAESFKAKAALLGLIEGVVGVNDGGVINGRGALLGNVVDCAVEMLSSEDWAARKAAAEVLERVALVAERESAAEVMGFVVTSLESRRFDKVKVTRETMNRALEAWKEVPGCAAGGLPLSRSNSSISKDNGNGGSSPPVSGRRSSYAGMETRKPKKTLTKSRSSLSDSPVATISPSITTPPREPHRKSTMSKSRSSFSDDSTITDSSSVSKASPDLSFETPQSKKPISMKKKSVSKRDHRKSSKSQNTESRKSSDWDIKIAIPPSPSTKVEHEDDIQSEYKSVEVNTSASETRSNMFKKTSEKKVQKFSGLSSGSQVVPFLEEDQSHGLIVENGANEEVGENNADIEDLSLIRKQLFQIERQQSNLLDLLQRFMGNSQSGINSLETRVSGLEKALDEISYDVAMQNGRIPNNGASAGNTCCPSTEFLSPKFWRRTEGRSSISKSSSTYSGNVLSKDANFEALQMDGQEWGNFEFNAAKSVKGISQNGQRGRTCSPRSFDSASTATCMTPGA